MDSNILSSTENILMSCTVADRHVCMQPLTFPELEELDSAAGLTLTYMYCTCVAVYIPVNSPWRFMLQKQTAADGSAALYCAPDIEIFALGIVQDQILKIWVNQTAYITPASFMLGVRFQLARLLEANIALEARLAHTTAVCYLCIGINNHASVHESHLI